MPNFYIIKKHYTDGGDEGHYKIKISPIKMTSDDFVENYELSAPIYKFDDVVCSSITIGVKEGSCFELWNINDVASELFGQTLCGEMVFTFEELEDEKATLPMMKKQLVENGMPPESINFGDIVVDAMDTMAEAPATKTLVKDGAHSMMPPSGTFFFNNLFLNNNNNNNK